MLLYVTILYRGQSWRRGVKCDCKIDWFGRSPLESAALSSAILYAMPPKLGGKWGTECLNTRFPLPTLPCARYSVKLI